MPPNVWPKLTVQQDIRIDLLDLGAALAWLHAAVAQRGPCRQVVASGFHGIWCAMQDPALRALLRKRALWLPDGIAPVVLARLLGARRAVRVPGPDFFAAVLRECPRGRPLRHFFLGDTRETLERLERHVREACPGHEVAGTESPPVRADWAVRTPVLVERVNRAAPDVLWVALGTPAQDAWIAVNRERLEVPVAVGVGAAFRFQVGALARCPAWLGNAGLEWLFRLTQQPSRLWRRYLVEGPRFLAGAAAAGYRGELRLEPAPVRGAHGPEPSAGV